MILFTAISGLANGIIVMIFGLLTWLHNPKNKANKLIGLLCLSVSLWSLTWVVSAFAENINVALLSMRILNFWAIFIPILFLHWILSLLNIEKNKINKIVLIIGYFITLFFAFFSFSDYFITVRPKPYFYYYAEPQMLHPFYLVFCYFGLAGFALYKLIKLYKKADGYKRAQIKYVFLGSFIGFGGGATNYLLYYNIPIPPFGNPLIAVGFGFFTYAVIRYRLMDIQIVIGKGIAYLFSFITIIGAGLLLAYSNSRLAVPLSIPVLVPFIALLSVALLRIHKFYENIAAKYFYQDFSNLKITIAELEERLTEVLELETLSSLIGNTLMNSFQLEKIAIFIKKIYEKEEKYIIQKSINFNKKELLFLIQNKGFKDCFNKNKKLLTKSEFQHLQGLLDSDIEILIPLVFKKQIIGIIMLGSKKSGDAFSIQDLELLTALSYQASVALKNASLFAEVNKRKEELESFYRLTVGRELKMVELKQKVKELEEKLEEKTKKNNK